MAASSSCPEVNEMMGHFSVNSADSMELVGRRLARSFFVAFNLLFTFILKLIEKTGQIVDDWRARRTFIGFL